MTPLVESCLFQGVDEFYLKNKNYVSFYNPNVIITLFLQPEKLITSIESHQFIKILLQYCIGCFLKFLKLEPPSTTSFQIVLQ